jgi:hypothetical protein
MRSFFTRGFDDARLYYIRLKGAALSACQKTRERESGFEPPLAALVPNIEGYKTVFLGFPIWGDGRAFGDPWRLWAWE